MPDNFEKAKDEILKETATNGGPKPIHLLNAMGALAQDVDEAMGGLSEKFDEHCIDSTGRLDEIDKWRSQLCTTLRDDHRAICEKHVNEMHHDRAVEMQQLGLVGENGEEQSRKVWFMWLIGSKLSYVFIAVAIFLLQMLSNWLWHLLTTQPQP